MEKFFYNRTQKHNNTEYYVMNDSEYKRLTNHILTVISTLLERNTFEGKRESYQSRHKRLDVLTTDKYKFRSTLHNEPISMLDAFCGMLQKINRKQNNDLTKKQIEFFNSILSDYADIVFDNADALNAEKIDMEQLQDDDNEPVFGNGLFSLD